MPCSIFGPGPSFQSRKTLPAFAEAQAAYELRRIKVAMTRDRRYGPQSAPTASSTSPSDDVPICLDDPTSANLAPAASVIAYCRLPSTETLYAFYDHPSFSEPYQRLRDGLFQAAARQHPSEDPGTARRAVATPLARARSLQELNHLLALGILRHDGHFLEHYFELNHAGVERAVWTALRYGASFIAELMLPR